MVKIRIRDIYRDIPIPMTIGLVIAEEGKRGLVGGDCDCGCGGCDEGTLLCGVGKPSKGWKVFGWVGSSLNMRAWGDWP